MGAILYNLEMISLSNEAGHLVKLHLVVETSDSKDFVLFLKMYEGFS